MKSRLFLLSLLPALWLGGPCRAQISDELFTPPTLFGDAKYIGPRTDFRMTASGVPHDQLVRTYKYMKILRPKVEKGTVSLSCSAKEAAAQGMPTEFYRYAKKFCRMTNRLSRTFSKADWRVMHDCTSVLEHDELWLSPYWLYGSGDSLRFSLSPEKAAECYGITPEVYRRTARTMRQGYDLLLESYEKYPDAIRGSDPTPYSIFIQISPLFPEAGNRTAVGQAKEQKKQYRKKMQRAYDTFLKKYDKLNSDYDPRYFERPQYKNDVNFVGLKLTMPLLPGATRMTIAPDGSNITIEKKKQASGK